MGLAKLFQHAVILETMETFEERLIRTKNCLIPYSIKFLRSSSMKATG